MIALSEPKVADLVDVRLTIARRGQEDCHEKIMMKPDHLRRLGRSRSCTLTGVEIPAGPLMIKNVDSRVHMSLFELARRIPNVVMSIVVTDPPISIARLLSEIARANQGPTQAVDPMRSPLPIGQRTADGRLFRLAPELVEKIVPGSLVEEIRGAISAIMKQIKGEKRYVREDHLLVEYWFEEVCSSKVLLDNATRLLNLVHEQARILTANDLLGIAGTREELRTWFDEVLSKARPSPRHRSSDGLFAVLGVALVKLGHTQYAPK